MYWLISSKIYRTIGKAFLYLRKGAFDHILDLCFRHALDIQKLIVQVLEVTFIITSAPDRSDNIWGPNRELGQICPFAIASSDFATNAAVSTGSKVHVLPGVSLFATASSLFCVEAKSCTETDLLAVSFGCSSTPTAAFATVASLEALNS